MFVWSWTGKHSPRCSPKAARSSRSRARRAAPRPPLRTGSTSTSLIVAARSAPCRARRDRARATASAGGGRPLDSTDRRPLWRQRNDGPALAAAIRVEDPAGSLRTARWAQARRTPARVCQARLGAVRAGWRSRPLPLRTLQHRSCQRSAAACEGDPRRRSRRTLHHVWLRRLCRSAAIPSSRSGDEGLRGQPPGDHEIAGATSVGGAQVRATVRKLSRDGRGWLCWPCPLRRTIAGSTTVFAVGGSSTAEHSAVNRRVVGSNPTPRASRRPRIRLSGCEAFFVRQGSGRRCRGRAR